MNKFTTQIEPAEVILPEDPTALSPVSPVAPVEGKKKFVEPTINMPVDIMETTAFFQGSPGGDTIEIL